MFTTVLLCGMLGGTGQAVDDECFAEQLKGARVTASVRFKHDGEDYSKGDSRLTVKVPKSWNLAAYLLLNGDTGRYRTAMRCLLRGPDAPFQYRDTERRAHPPRVTVQKKWITVEQPATTWILNLQERTFGPWRVTEGNRLWTLELIRPTALKGAWWQEVTVDLGGRAARRVSPAPDVGSTNRLTWTRERTGGEPPDVRITLQPPAAKATAARWGELPWFAMDRLVWLSYDVAVLGLLLAAVRTARKPPVSSPPTDAEERTPTDAEERTPTDAEERTVSCLLALSWLAFAITVVHYVNNVYLEHVGGLVAALLTGLALCVFGRPGPTAGALAIVASGYVTAVVCRPEWFELPSGLELDWQEAPEAVRSLRGEGGMYAFVMACACLVFVWLVGLASSLMRLWRSCDPPRPGWSQGRFPLTVLGALVPLSVAIPVMGVWTAQNAWHHRSWLSRRDGDYGLWHTSSLFNDDVRWFPSTWLDWFSGNYLWWWGPSLAIVAVLRARDKAAAQPAVLPSPPEVRILKAFFIVAVAPLVGWYAGIPLALPSLLTVWLALTALLAFGTRRAVLYRELLPGVRLHEVTKASDRRLLLKAARRHRELHARLRRLEQGQQDGERPQLEHELDRLHRLRHPSPPPGLPSTWIRLPSSVGPVELTLAWGPRTTWWGNACRAAYFATLASVPAAGVLLWAEHVRGTLWTDKFVDRLGFVDTVASLMSIMIVWAGAGFTLGALWRVLPGHRGPVRAFWLSLVYAAPVFVHWIGVRLVDQPFHTWALDISLTLLVLTVTGVAMDFDTFRREGHYWPTKAGLLMSVYQWRTASIQVAFLVGQIVALVTIWQQLKGNEPMVFIERNPSETSGGGSSGGSP
jgi:hypothetical protein